MSAPVIWITGLPGSGKSAVADEVVKSSPGCVLLRMDEMRKVVTPEPTYSSEERDHLYRALVYFAKRLSELGHTVIIDATGNLRVWRDLARSLIPAYREVYLRCSLEVCMRRERERTETREAPRGVYRKGSEGWPVPGVAAPYQEPVNAEVTIDTDAVTVEEAGAIVRKMLVEVQDTRPSPST